MTEPTAWPTRAAFEAWWRENVIELNRLSVTSPREYERLADKIAGYLAQIPQQEAA